MDCYNSSDPVAPNATLLYDFNEDQRDFWRRSSQDVPLPPCFPPPSSFLSRCLVCVDQIVHAMCRNLTDGVKMMMEAGGDKVKLSRSECPKPPSGDAPQPQHPNTMIYIFPILLVFLLVVVFIIYRKCCKNPKELRGEEINTHSEEESSIITEPTLQETEIP